MARRQNFSLIKNGCLASLILIAVQTHGADNFKLGKVTQAAGKITYLSFTAPNSLIRVKNKHSIRSNGSYLTQDSAYFTFKLFDGSWIRVSPKTKFSLEFEPTQKIITMHLFTGSIKSLFSAKLGHEKIQKILIKSGDAQVESSEGKFCVVRNNLTDSTNLYVEKGAVMATQYQGHQKKDMELVHSKEMVFVQDRKADIEVPLPMTEKEVKFLHSNFYLKSVKDKNKEI